MKTPRLTIIKNDSPHHHGPTQAEVIPITRAKGWQRNRNVRLNPGGCRNYGPATPAHITTATHHRPNYRPQSLGDLKLFGPGPICLAWYSPSAPAVGRPAPSNTPTFDEAA